MTDQIGSRELFISCDCGHPDHQLIFTFDPNEADPHHQEICAYVHLARQPVWRRIIDGIKYIFGHTCAYGHFDVVLINPETALKLWDFIGEFYSSVKRTTEGR